MTVHQIDEYYVHVDIKGVSDNNREKLKTLLIENGCDDFEFRDTELIIDDLSGCAADSIDRDINDYLNKFNLGGNNE